MRFKTPVLWALRCAVCLSLGLAGCTAGGPTRFQAQTPQSPSQLDTGPAAAGDAAGSARQQLAVGSKEGQRPGAAAQPVRLASFSAEGQPPVPDPPDDLVREHDARVRTAVQHLLDELRADAAAR